MADTPCAMFGHQPGNHEVRPIANRHWRQANSLGEQPTKLNTDVRFWPLADIRFAQVDVRFWR